MKNRWEKRQDQAQKVYQRIINSLGTRKAIKTYGLDQVKWAMNRFAKETAEQKKLQKEKRKLEQRLAEIESKSAF